MRSRSSALFRAACVAGAAALSAFAQGGGSANSLEELVRTALARNPDLLAARQRLAEAQGLLRQAGLRPNPSLDVSVANGDVLNSRGERQFELGYSHVFETGGKRNLQVDAARLRAEVVRLEIADRERLLRADVKARYVEALAAMRNLGNARGLLELTRKGHELALARTREGEGSPLEQGLLQVEVNRIDSDRLLFESQVERAVLDLEFLAGMDAGGSLLVTERLAPPLVTIEPERAVEQALAGRPDLQAARIEESLAGAESAIARAEASPNVVATGRYQHTRSRFDQYGFAQPGGPITPLRDRDNVMTVGISIALPVRNRNQGNIEASVARARAARLRRDALERSVRREVRAAVNRYEAARRALRILEQGVVEQSSENLRIIRGAYELGELRLLDVINEQRRLLEAQRGYTELLRDTNAAVAELERAIGRPVE